jgi:hypothetical protein
MSITPAHPADFTMSTHARTVARSPAQGHNAQSAEPITQHSTQLMEGDRIDCVRTRKVTVSFTGSLDSFALSDLSPDLSARSTHWSVPTAEHAAELFGITGFAAKDVPSRQVNLKQVRFHECRVIARHSTFPVPLAVDVTGMKGEYYTNTGKRSTLHLFPGTSTVSEVVLKKSPLLLSTFAEEYPGYTSDNLRTLGITSAPTGNMRMIANSHPAIGMMRMNADVLNVGESLETESSMRTGFHMISGETVDRVLSVLEKEVVCRMPDVRCTAFGADLSRLETDLDGNSVRMNDPTGLATSVATDVIGTAAVTFELTFELPRARV